MMRPISRLDFESDLDREEEKREEQKSQCTKSSDLIR